MNKVVLVTGASSGIGLAVASHLSQSGFTVYGGSRSAPVSQLFHSVRLDVTNDESVTWVVNSIIEKEGRIDAVVNNAGVGSAGAVEKTPIADIQRSFDVNVLGMVRVCQAVMPQMRKQKAGKIINMSTLGSTIGMPYRAFYSSSKGAVDLISESLRLEVEHFGIQSCTIHPGDVRTNIAAHRIISTTGEDETYGKTFKKVFDELNSSVDHGRNPEFFGPYIERIIKSKKIKRNYCVGSFNELLGIRLKKFLPYYIYEWILRQYFKAED